jgi:hypothetical protein
MGWSRTNLSNGLTLESVGKADFACAKRKQNQLSQQVF